MGHRKEALRTPAAERIFSTDHNVLLGVTAVVLGGFVKFAVRIVKRDRIVGEQFTWNVHYPGADGRFGATTPSLISASNPLGLDRSSCAAS